MSEIDIRGAGGGGGNSGGGAVQRAAVEDPDSLYSTSVIGIVDLLGEGEIGGLVDGAKSIFLNDTPLVASDGTVNFASTTDPGGVWWDQRVGTQNQTAFTDGAVNGISSAFSLRQKLIAGMPYSYTVQSPTANEISVVLSTPSLLQQDSGTGDVHGSRVEFRIEVSINNAPYTLVGDYEIAGKTRSQYQRQITFPIAAGTLRTIRVSRTSGNSTSTMTQNELYFDSVSENTSRKLRYPNSALVAMKINASQFSSVPSRAYHVRGLYIKVPSNYNASTRQYTGVWDGTFKLAISDNPAWIMYDIVTESRYGLGQWLKQHHVDKSTLYKIGKYCDELVPDGFGGWEPRFTINTVINTASEAYKLLSEIASVFRGMGFWAGDIVSFTCDSPADPTIIYNHTNIIEGSLTYAGTSVRDRHSVALITWNDPADNYRQKIEYVDDPELIKKYGIRKTDMVAFGCTSRGQAHRVGRWMLYTEDRESQLITFKVGIDSALVRPGTIAILHDEHRAGKRMGGRIMGSTANSLTLDAPATLSAAPGTAIIAVMLSDGTYAERRIVEGNGTFQTLTFVDPLTTMPVNGAVFIVSEPNLIPMQVRIVGIAQSDSQSEFQITAVQQDPTKYAAIEYGYKLMDSSAIFGKIDRGIVTVPSDVKTSSSTYTYEAGLTRSKIYVTWSCNMPLYEVAWRKSGIGAVWKFEKTSTPYVEVDGVDDGTYEFRIVAINAFGKTSQPVTASYVFSKTATVPANVTGATLKFDGRDANISWRINSVTGSYEFGSEPQYADQGALDGNFLDWEVSIINLETGYSVRTEHVTQPYYIYTYDNNYHDFSRYQSTGHSAARYFDVRIRTRYRDGTVGDYVSLSASNPQSVITADMVTLEASFDAITVKYKRPTDIDFAGVKMWIGTDPQVPMGASPRFSGPDSSVVFSGLTSNTQYYIRIVPYDLFGTSEADTGFIVTTTTNVISANAIGEGVIGKSKLLDSLRSEIDLISAPSSVPGSVAALIKQESDTRTQSDEAIATQVSTLQSSITATKAYRIDAMGMSSTLGTSNGVFFNGSKIHNPSRSWNVLVIDRSNGNVVSHTSYDVFASVSNASAMASQLNSIDATKVVVCYTCDEPQTNVVNNSALKTALKRFGASEGALANLKYRSAYILVGTADSGEGTGIEKYAGSVDSDAKAFVTYTLMLQNGEPIAFGSAGTVALQVQAQTQANLITGLSAQYTVKVDNNGYISGYGLASTTVNGVPYSEFLINANTFAVVTPGYNKEYPFTIGLVNGSYKTVIKSAVIEDASIGSAKIADASIGSAKIANQIQSDNYAAGAAGWMINKSGTAEFSKILIRNSASGARLEIKENVIKVFDSNGTLRVRIGDLSA